MRVLSLDWLEVYVMESLPIYNCLPTETVVSFREYGTRVYRQMFTVTYDDGFEVEVRRDPVSTVLPAGSAHVRVTNSSLYLYDAVARLRSFLEATGCTFVRISKVDICLDFLKFDDGTDPQDFLKRYLRGAYSKVNQSSVSLHGSDTWEERQWNSVSWGSRSSPIFTRFYDKSLELASGTDCVLRGKKTYIPRMWISCGLVSEDYLSHTLDVTPHVWRLEFSISSSVKRWVTINLDGSAARYSIRHDLDAIASRESCLVLFMALCDHYFHFHKFVPHVRKDRCPDRVLFRWKRHDKLAPFVEKTTAGSSQDYFLQQFCRDSIRYRSMFPTDLSQSFVADVVQRLIRNVSLSHTSDFSFDETRQSLNISPSVFRSACE